MKRTFIIAMALMVCTLCMAQKQLPGLTYGSEPATLLLIVKHYTPNADDKVTLKYVSGASGEKKSVYNDEISTTGEFRTSVVLSYTQLVTLTFPDLEKSVQFLMTPGKETVVTVDAKLLNDPNAKKPAWTFKGDNADFNKDFANYGDKYSSRNILSQLSGEGLKQFKDKGIADYRATMLKMYADCIAEVNADKRLSGVYKDYMKTVYQQTTATAMTGCASILAYANGKKATDYVMPEDYWNEVKDWNLFGTDNALYTQYVSSLSEYASSMNDLMNVTTNTVPESFGQLAKARKYCATIDNLQVLTPEELQKVAADCPAFEQEILDKNAAMKAMLEENARNPQFVIKSIPEDLKGEDVFKALVEPYKGKPTLVDFWATWCGPCKAAMKTIEPLKQELKGKVNFIYVTGPSSPKETWNKMIPTIHGDHYYVTAEQYDTLLKQFESQGIPTYVIVDDYGAVAHKHIGYPGNEVIKEELTNKHLGYKRPDIVKE